MQKQTIKLLLVFFLICLQQKTDAQMIREGLVYYGNEWINYTQSYFKVKIVEDGIHRISYQELASAGVFAESIVPEGRNFNMYWMGEAVPIYVSTEGTLEISDYIEFYGEKNRGWLDQFLYSTPSHQLNPEYSMYTDTSIYFLTWSNNTTRNQISNISNNLNDLPSKENYCLSEVSYEYHNKFSRGIQYSSSSESISCKYDIAEGYSRNVFNNKQQYTLSTPNLYVTERNSELVTRLYTKNGNHTLQLDINNETVEQESFSGWAVKEYETNITTSGLQENNELSIQGLNNEEDEFSVANIKITYPRTFNFQGKSEIKFTLERSDNSKYLEISNFAYNNNTPILYDLTNRLKIVPTIEGNLLKIHLPPSAQDREIYLVSVENILSIANIEKRSFEKFDFDQDQFNYIILSHKRLIEDPNNYAQEYTQYRSSEQGGAFQSLLVDVTQLYDQFGYGVNRHEVAIRNFLNLAHKNWNTEYLFLLGKGINRETMRRGNINSTFDLVPSFGYPNSDYLFVMEQDSNIPRMAVGRIAAYTPEHVRIYLKKIKEHESAFLNVEQTIENKGWSKRVLHFAGGDPSIQSFIRGTLNNLKDTLDNSLYGSDVRVFAKESSTSTVYNVPEQVNDLIDNGTTMLTFFGHSAPNTLDFNLASPEEYNNKGKYPLFYAIGCNTNRVFDNISTLSEDWVLIEDKGAIGFFGSTWLTQLSNLSNYARLFYKNLGGDNYDDRLGEVVRATLEDFTLSTSFSTEQTKQVLMLHGDPAIKLYTYKKPDYLVNEKQSNIFPDIVDLQKDSFQLQLRITNIGKAIEDSLDIKIEYTLEDGSLSKLASFKVKAPKFQEDHIFILPLGNNKDSLTIGKNNLKITLDSNNFIEEGPIGAEDNNVVSIPFFVTTSDIQPIFPTNFSIIYESKPTLKASTTDAFSKSFRYFIELDTTEHFDSNLKINQTIEQIGGLLEWQPNIELLSNTVYYWRIGIDNKITGQEEIRWKTQSFTYIKNSSEGWNQGHYFQYAQNGKQDLDLNSWNFKFSDLFKSITALNGSFPSLNWEEVAINVNGFREIAYYPCDNNTPKNTLQVVEFDQYSLEVVKHFDPCRNRSRKRQEFEAKTQSERERLTNYIQDTIKSGNYVVVLTTLIEGQDLGAEKWAADSLIYGTNVFQTLEKQGVKYIRGIEGNQTPFILIFQKNTPSFPVAEAYALAQQDIVTIESFFKGKNSKAHLASTIIGPSTSWQSLEWQTSEKEASDTTYIKILGLSNDQKTKTLIDSTFTNDFSLDNVDATLYPYLQLEYHVKDEVNRTPAQLDFWRVLYDPLPDAALAPNIDFTFQSDTLQQGEVLSMELAIANATNVSMDSLLVQYTVIDEQNREQIYQRINAPLQKQGNIIAKFDLDTKDLQGKHRLLIEANADQGQAELYAFNNNGIKEFFVETDKRNPLLDVTFDGVRILNGDMVSAEPQIVVNLKDENQYLALNDTSLLKVGVLYPSGELRKFYFGGNQMTFIPAQEDNLEKENLARIEFEPIFKENGTYQLQILASDRSGNQSGDYLYTVDFEIITESQISNVFNYPNPFSTSTQFVFTLTGSDLPEDIRIQILTVSGRVVREISMAELGEIRIGHNRTSFRWDGTDDFGDQLANGVYLYRVTVKGGGDTNFEKFDTNTDQYFQGEIGKMVIIR